MNRNCLLDNAADMGFQKGFEEGRKRGHDEGVIEAFGMTVHFLQYVNAADEDIARYKALLRTIYSYVLPKIEL